MPYLYEVVKEIHGEAGAIYDLELKMKNQLKEYHIVPNIAFNGHKTECFKHLLMASDTLTTD